MILWIVLAISLSIVISDIVFYRLRIARLNNRGLRLSVAGLMILSDTTPLLLAAAFFLTSDNSTAMMMANMWLAWLFSITILPRMTYYIFSLFGRRGIAQYVGMAAAALVLFAFLAGTIYGRTAIQVNRVEISSDKLPEAFDGLRIAQFSDLHIGTLLCPERELARLVDTINSLSPDLVVFSGDLVNIRYSELGEKQMEILGRLKASYGVISVIGNHDVGLYIKDTVALPRVLNTQRLKERQRDMGWRILEDSTIYIVRGKDSVTVSGLSFPPKLQKFRHSFDMPDIDISDTYDSVPQNTYNITVSHLPQLWKNIRSEGYGDLTLSGHVHSMQLKINLFGHKFSPAQFIYDQWSGRYDTDGSTLYINDGIGYVGFPVRMGARPEVTLFVLGR